MAKPFLKWAGGKTQLLDSIEQNIPTEFEYQEFTYVEAFAGSSAVFFWMLKKYPTLKKAILNDISNVKDTNSENNFFDEQIAA